MPELLNVKPFGQPHSMGCLPTCVRAVRDFYGEKLSYQDASELCDEQPSTGGCDWDGAVASLSLSYDVVELEVNENIALTELVRTTEGGDPVVAHLFWNGLHAVVIVGVDVEGGTVRVMDPASGQGGRIVDVPATEFLQRWVTLGYSGFYFEE